MIINKFVNKEYQKLISNILFSGIFQIVTFLSPLITTPYLVKIIGIEKFGFVSFVTVFFAYLYSITDYGFNITANREIALNRNSKDILSKIFADVMFAKVLLSLVALILLLICVLIIPKFKSNSITFLLSFTLIIGRVLIPNWFFQGLEQMRRLSILNFFSQILFILLIFLVVKKPNDYKYVVFLQGISYIFIGIISLIIIFSRILLDVTLVFRLKGAVNQIKYTFNVFISSISIVSYNNANLLILGFFANDKIVGYYGIVDKVINVIRQAIGAVSIAIFPHICRLSQLSHEAVYDFFKKFYMNIILGIIFISISMIIFAEEIVYLLVSASDFQLQNTFVLMSFVPIVVILSNPPCFILLANNKSKAVSQIMVVGCLLNVMLNLILVPLFNIKGTIISVYITEFFITTTLSYLLIKIYPQFSFLKIAKIIKMNSFSRRVKNAIVGLIKDTVFEKSFYELKLKYDLAVMNNAGKNHTYDSETFKIISTLPQDANCIDVGCHKGDILAKIIEVASGGKHFAFEPIDELYDNLKNKFKNVNLHKIALSNLKGNAVFYNVITGQGVSGLRQREYDRVHKTIEIKVETDLLDNIIPENLKIDFIKFDIEGGEYDAMRGGENLIRKFKPIMVFEFEKGAAEKYGATPGMIYDFIVKDLNMKLSLQKYWLMNKRDFCFKREEFIKQFESNENFYFIAFN